MYHQDIVFTASYHTEAEAKRFSETFPEQPLIQLTAGAMHISLQRRFVQIQDFRHWIHCRKQDEVY